MNITSRKISESWLVTDGINRIIVYVNPDYTYNTYRIRVKEESFIKKALTEVTNSIEI